MKNIVLIGMPGVGKSTLGVLLAKAFLYDFCDTDLVIQKKTHSSLCDYIAKNGTEAFLNLENVALSSLKLQNTVIATGGSAVYGDAAMKNLKENGIAVYLRLPVKELEKRVRDIKARGVVLTHGSTLGELFSEREPLYKKYADITVDLNGRTVEENVEAVRTAIINLL